MAGDSTSSNDYENYVSQLDILPKLDAPVGGEGSKMTVTNGSHTQRDSSDDEIMVSKLSNAIPTAESKKPKSTRRCFVMSLLMNG